MEMLEDAEELRREFLGNRQRELPKLRVLLLEGNFPELKRLGHNMKGNGASYGVPEFTAFGARIEEAAAKGDTPECAQALADIEEFLRTAIVINVP